MSENDDGTLVIEPQASLRGRIVTAAMIAGCSVLTFATTFNRITNVSVRCAGPTCTITQERFLSAATSTPVSSAERATVLRRVERESKRDVTRLYVVLAGNELRPPNDSKDDVDALVARINEPRDGVRDVSWATQMRTGVWIVVAMGAVLPLAFLLHRLRTRRRALVVDRGRGEVRVERVSPLRRTWRSVESRMPLRDVDSVRVRKVVVGRRAAVTYVDVVSRFGTAICAGEVSGDDVARHLGVRVIRDGA